MWPKSGNNCSHVSTCESSTHLKNLNSVPDAVAAVNKSVDADHVSLRTTNLWKNGEEEELQEFRSDLHTKGFPASLAIELVGLVAKPPPSAARAAAKKCDRSERHYCSLGGERIGSTLAVRAIGLPSSEFNLVIPRKP